MDSSTDQHTLIIGLALDARRIMTVAGNAAGRAGRVHNPPTSVPSARLSRGGEGSPVVETPLSICSFCAPFTGAAARAQNRADDSREFRGLVEDRAGYSLPALHRLEEQGWIADAASIEGQCE